MDKRKLSHDILNLLERLRIMHDLAKEQSYTQISQEELRADLAASLKELEEKFKALVQ